MAHIPVRHPPGDLRSSKSAVLPICQRFGSALNLNVHFHMLFLDGVHVERPDSSLHFRWVKEPTSAELGRLTQTLAQSIGRYLERQGLLERDAENSYLADDELELGAMAQLLSSSITYRIAVGPQGVHATDAAGERGAVR